MTCEPEDKGQGAAHFLKLAKILVVFRFLRFVRLIRLIRLYTEHHQIKRAIRQTVSQVCRAAFDPSKMFQTLFIEQASLPEGRSGP